jgi:hypothetical protein
MTKRKTKTKTSRTPRSSRNLFLDPELEALVDGILDADDPTLYRMWRYAAVGMDFSSAMKQLPEYRGITLRVPSVEHAKLGAAARRRNVTPTQLVRQIVAEWLTETEGIPAEDVPWLMQHGLPEWIRQK